MRNATKLVLLASIAFAVTASPSQAQSDVELTEGGSHCEEVTVSEHIVSGGCELKAVGEGNWTITQHLFGIEGTIMDDCQSDFELNFDEDGLGYISAIQFGGRGECADLEAETEASGAQIPWDIIIYESGAPAGKLNLSVEFDMDHDTTPISGNAVLQLSEHTCCITVTDIRITGTNYEIQGAWALTRDNNAPANDHIGVTHR